MAIDGDYSTPTPAANGNGKSNGHTSPLAEELGTARAPKGGIRHGGRTYKAGEVLPRRYERALQQGQQHRDPSNANRSIPPGFGRPVFPQIVTFSGRLSMVANVYRNPDEAVKHSLENARFMRNDCSVMECLEARQRCTALLNWHLEPEDPKDARQKQLANDLTWVIKKIPQFAEYRRNLLEALWYGRYACQHAYGFKRRDGKRYVVINRWLPINGDKLAFRYDDGSGRFTDEQIGIKIGPAFNHKDLLTGGRKIEYTDFGPVYFLEPWERPRVAVHKHIIEDGVYEDAISAGRIHGVGIRDRIYWTWFQKQETMAQLMEVIERTGTGFTIYWYPHGNAEAKSQVEAVAENQTHENVLIMPRMSGDPSMDAFGIDRIEPSTGGIEALRQIIHEFFGHQIKRYILGQILSSESEATGLGSGVADLHKGTMALVVQYDAMKLEETLTTEVVTPLKDLNFPWAQDLTVYFKIDTESDKAQEKMGAYKQAWDMGCRLKAQEIMDVIGASMPTADDEVLQNPAMIQQARLAAGKFEGQDQDQLQHLFGPLAGLLGGGGGEGGQDPDAEAGPEQPPGDGGGGGDGPPGGAGLTGPGGMPQPQQFSRRRYAALAGATIPGQQHFVGETKFINGVTYRLNENHRWVLDRDGDGQSDRKDSSVGILGSQAAAKARSIGFTTEKGSVYTIDEQGRTQRTKSAHAGHDKDDVGLKEASDQTFFVDPEHAQLIGMHNSLDKSAKPRVLIRDNYALLVSWNAKENRWGRHGEPIPLSNSPTMGRSPLEVWGMKHDKELGGMVPSKNHPGNKITELQGGDDEGDGEDASLGEMPGDDAASADADSGDASEDSSIGQPPNAADDHAQRHEFVTSQLRSVDGGIAAIIGRMHRTKTYQRGGEVAVENLSRGRGQALYKQLQQAATSGGAGGPVVVLPSGQQTQAVSAMGGHVVDLGEGRMGFASKAGSLVVWPPDASGKQKVSYTTRTGIVSEAAGLQAVTPGGSAPGQAAGQPVGQPAGQVTLPGIEGEDPDGEIPEAELDEDEDGPHDVTGETVNRQPRGGSGVPPIDPRPLRQSADQARKKYESAVRLWESEHAKGIDSKTHSLHRSNVAALKSIWRERERLAGDAERGAKRHGDERRKAASLAEKEAMKRLGIGGEKLAKTGKGIRDAAAGEAEEDARRRGGAKTEPETPLLDNPPGAGTDGAGVPTAGAEGLEKSKMTRRQQRLVDMAKGYMDRFQVSGSDKNRSAIRKAIATGRISHPAQLRRVLRTARKIHERGNIAEDDHGSLQESIRRRANREATAISPKKLIRERASGHGMPESDYRQLVDDLHRERRSHHDEYEAAKAAARKSTGLSAKDIRRLEEQGHDSGSDHPKIRGLDVVAEDLANNYPALGWARTADTGGSGSGIGQDHGEKLWELLKEGRKPPIGKFSDEFLNEVDSFLMAEAGRGGGSSDSEDDALADLSQREEEAIPFSRRKSAKWHRRYAKESEPTEAQKEAGNYKMRHVRLHGLGVSIENEKGTRRRPDWPELSAAYGYIKRTEGRDGDHVDLFIGPDESSDVVYVIDQVTEGGRFDEHKCMIGWTNKEDACKAYLANYTPDWKLGPVTAMTIDQFKCWLAEGDTTKPVADQVSKYARKQPKSSPGQKSFAETYASGLAGGKWREELHPRDESGKFDEAGSGGRVPSSPGQRVIPELLQDWTEREPAASEANNEAGDDDTSLEDELSEVGPAEAPESPDSLTGLDPNRGKKWIAEVAEARLHREAMAAELDMPIDAKRELVAAERKRRKDSKDENARMLPTKEQVREAKRDLRSKAD